MSALLFLRHIPGILLDVGGDLLGWLVERPARLIILMLIVLSVWLWIGRDQARDLAESRRAEAAAWQSMFRHQRAEMLKFTAIVKSARVEAARLDQANVDRVRAAWSVNVEDVTHAYQTELAAMRAAVSHRLRDTGQRPGADCAVSRGANAQLSSVPVLSDGPVRPGDAAIVDAADIDACTVNTVRLEHLADAWRRAAALNVNGP